MTALPCKQISQIPPKLLQNLPKKSVRLAALYERIAHDRFWILWSPFFFEAFIISPDKKFKNLVLWNKCCYLDPEGWNIKYSLSLIM